MLAGRLRDRIHILARESEPTPYGERETWTRKETRWGRFSTVRVESRAAYMQSINTDATHRVTFRKGPEISARDTRLEWRGNQYEVLEAPADEQISGNPVMHVIVRQI